MTEVVVLVAAFLAALLLWSCAQVRYVPLCSQHGGIRSIKVSDNEDQWATRDAVCKDGTSQRPMQIDDGNGKWHFVVPADR